MVTITVVNGGPAITIRTAGSRRLNPLVDGDVDFQRYRAKNARIQGPSEEFLDLGDITGSVEVDLSVATIQKVALVGAVAFSFVGAPPADQTGTFMLHIVNPGLHAIAWPASVDFGDDTLTGLPASGRARFAFTTDDGGESWDAVLSFVKTN